MRIVCISDTHNNHEQITVPGGDVLIHAGDATNRGTESETESFLGWYSELPHPYKIYVAGNHDWLYEKDNRRARALTAAYGITYLQDSFAEIEGLKIYGSPWQPRFFDWAFNLNRGAEMAEKWKLIPVDTDILITHGPPHGILDKVRRRFFAENTGCEQLRARVEEIAAYGRLKAHVFGHIHCGYGTQDFFGVKFINAANCDEEYNPTQLPVVFDLGMRDEGRGTRDKGKSVD